MEGRRRSLIMMENGSIINRRDLGLGDTGVLFVNTNYCIVGNLRQEKIFANFATCSHWQNFYP